MRQPRCRGNWALDISTWGRSERCSSDKAHVASVRLKAADKRLNNSVNVLKWGTKAWAPQRTSVAAGCCKQSLLSLQSYNITGPPSLWLMKVPRLQGPILNSREHPLQPHNSSPVRATAAFMVMHYKCKRVSGSHTTAEFPCLTVRGERGGEGLLRCREIWVQWSCQYNVQITLLTASASGGWSSIQISLRRWNVLLVIMDMITAARWQMAAGSTVYIPESNISEEFHLFYTEVYTTYCIMLPRLWRSYAELLLWLIIHFIKH